MKHYDTSGITQVTAGKTGWKAVEGNFTFQLGDACFTSETASAFQVIYCQPISKKFSPWALAVLRENRKYFHLRLQAEFSRWITCDSR